MPVTEDPRPETLDLEATLRDPAKDSAQELRLWLRMLSCTNRVSNEVRSRLRAEFGVTLPRFDLLAQLDRERDGLRLGELSRRLMVTNGNVTGLVGRLVAEGLIRRDTDADRRAAVVRLTPLGKSTFRKMALAHDAWLREVLSDLDKTTLAALMDGLAQIKRSVAQHATRQTQEAGEGGGRKGARSMRRTAALRARD